MLAKLPDDALLVTAISFEERSLAFVRHFILSEGDRSSVFAANIKEDSSRYYEVLSEFTLLGIKNIAEVDRFDTRTMWNWALYTLRKISDSNKAIILDISCMPRDLIGMLIYLLNQLRDNFRSIYIAYVTVPESGYATQNPDLEEDDQWLSKGVASVRSIIGYPGVFRTERSSHLVALAGHEFERLYSIAEFVEPNKLTVGGECKTSSTARGAYEKSEEVANRLKARIPVKEIVDISFSASSIEQVVHYLSQLDLSFEDENITLAAMNTKISFVGASLFSLQNRSIRMVYAVPSEYNARYSNGVGDMQLFDITSKIHDIRLRN